MLKRKNSKAFTLIEIIAVLVILGILASIALSSMFSWIEKSRSAELVPVLKGMADQIDACVLSKGFTVQNIGSCVNSVAVPSNITNNTPHFTLTITDVSNGRGGKWGYGLYYMSNTSGAAVTYPSCPELSNLSGTTDNTYGIIAICSYPQDGSNVSAYAGQRLFQAAGGYTGMF